MDRPFLHDQSCVTSGCSRVGAELQVGQRGCTSTLSSTIGSTTQEQDGLVVIVTPTYQTRRHIPEHMVRALLAASDWRTRVIMLVMLPSFGQVCG
jgi:hypothetical protein